MTNWFLRAKHWQLFVLIFGVPIVLEIIGMIVVALLREPMLLFVFFAPVMLLIIGIQFGWMYSVGNALGKKLPENAGMNVKRFRNFILVPPAYISLIVLGILVIGAFAATGGRPSPLFALSLVIILPLHFFSVFCIFYGIWFIAKSLKMVERWNHVQFGDYAGEFFLIWFLFVGIWFIQPRINRLFDPNLPPEPPKPQPYYGQYQQPYYGQYPGYSQGQPQNPYPGQYPNPNPPGNPPA